MEGRAGRVKGMEGRGGKGERESRRRACRKGRKGRGNRNRVPRVGCTISARGGAGFEMAGCMLDFASPGVLLLLQSVVFHGAVLP